MTRNEQSDAGDAFCQRPFSDLGRLTLPRAVGLICQAAVQLDRFHARFGAHGALTPATLVISGDDVVTINPPQRTAAAHADCRPFWSPQRHAGEPPRPSDDLYSLGMIARLLIAATEQSAQDGARDDELRVRIDATLAALTSWSPAGRPANGSEAAFALQRLALERGSRPAGVTDVEPPPQQAPEPAWAAAHRVAIARRAHRLAQSTPPRPARPARPRQIRAPLGKGHYPDMPLSTGWVAALILILCSVYLLPVYFMFFPAG